MLKRLILTLALLIGAFVATPSATQASSLGASAQAQQATPSNVEKAQFYFYRRRYYRPRYYGYRRYYRPRFYGYRRYYRPRYRFYRYY